MISKPMLAKKYDGINPRGYWMSEKLDGVRALWTGKQFVSRNGNIFPAPPELIAQMPKGVIIDGEVFGGRGTFQKTVGRVRTGDWSGLQFVAFDIITTAPFEERLQQLQALHLPGFCRVLEQTVCLNHKHLDQYEQGLLLLGAEGVMIRKKGSLYENKRSSSLMKVKRFKDAEATVIGHQPGVGKHAGRLGALLVKMAGKTFKIGTGLTDQERQTPPCIGALVTFTFFELTDGGTPRFPSFIGCRDYE